MLYKMTLGAENQVKKWFLSPKPNLQHPYKKRPKAIPYVAQGFGFSS